MSETLKLPAILALSSQCLDRGIPDKQMLVEKVAAWEHDRNAHHAKANWRFTTPDTRINLRRLGRRLLPVLAKGDVAGPRSGPCLGGFRPGGKICRGIELGAARVGLPRSRRPGAQGAEEDCDE